MKKIKKFKKWSKIIKILLKINLFVKTKNLRGSKPNEADQIQFLNKVLICYFIIYFMTSVVSFLITYPFLVASVLAWKPLLLGFR